MSTEAAPAPAAALERLELRIERLELTFRFTYAFHAREVRFERDAGRGFERLFPETFSFHADRHDPAELYLNFDDLSRKPRLLSPRANRRDAEVLISRLLLGLPRYLERVLERVQSGGRLEGPALARVHQDVALLAQIALRFASTLDTQARPGIQVAIFHLRKLIFHSLYALVESRVEAAYLDAYMDGSADPVNAADDLSEAGFFHTMESGQADAVNRCLLRLTERAFYRWLEGVCLDEENGAFELAESPFEGREIEVRRAISRAGSLRLRLTRDLSPFLRRPGNLDCRRVLDKLSRWFLRQYDVYHAALVIHHGDALGRGRQASERVLSRHTARTYLTTLVVLVSPFLGAALFYERAPALFDAACATELAAAMAAAAWFLGWRFCWRKDLTFFRASVPRIAAGIIVGYLPIFFIDEVWSLADQSWATITSIAVLLGFVTLMYLYIEVQRRLDDPPLAFARAREIFLLGVLQAFSIGLVVTGLLGGFMVSRNWGGGEFPSLAALSEGLPPFLGELPKVVGIEPFYAFPSAILLMTFMSFFIGTFLQLMWEDIPLTEPL